jgi:hypothetical protein
MDSRGGLLSPTPHKGRVLRIKINYPIIEEGLRFDAFKLFNCKIIWNVITIIL